MKKNEIIEIDKIVYRTKDLLLREIVTISQLQKFLDRKMEESEVIEIVEENKEDKKRINDFFEIVVKIDSLESLTTELNITVKDQRINFSFFPPHYNREVCLKVKLFSFEEEAFSPDIISVMNNEDFRPACFHELLFSKKFFSKKKTDENTPIVSLLFPYSPPNGGKFSPFLNNLGEIYLANFSSPWEKKWRFLGVKMK